MTVGVGILLKFTSFLTLKIGFLNKLIVGRLLGGREKGKPCLTSRRGKQKLKIFKNIHTWYATDNSYLLKSVHKKLCLLTLWNLSSNHNKIFHDSYFQAIQIGFFFFFYQFIQTGKVVQNRHLWLPIVTFLLVWLLWWLLSCAFMIKILSKCQDYLL